MIQSVSLKVEGSYFHLIQSVSLKVEGRVGLAGVVGWSGSVGNSFTKRKAITLESIFKKLASAIAQLFVNFFLNLYISSSLLGLAGAVGW